MMYVDTSVLVSCYTPEDRSDEANAIVSGRTDLVISDVGVAEYHVVIARKVRQKMLSRPAALRAVSVFEDYFGKDKRRCVSLNQGHIDRIKSLANKPYFTLRTLDALHLVVAEDLGATLATFDTRLSEAAKACGLKVVP